ncbi:MAG TPA: fused MFS/spermidine synthase [Candidatus Angelobacter sp.]|nr:fused MFS/spermidine synthase [Candidatus Angelobacter sp.]
MPLRTVLYATAIFLGSFLLFLVEPIAGKRLLPLLGGSAAVWTTCLVFFQTMLLLGYACAHWLATRLRPQAQALVYSVLLLAAVGQAWFSLHPRLQASTLHPIAGAFLVLTTLIGLPFFVLSATNPLLQSWYSRAFAKAAASGTANETVVEVMTPPYRLFALSNFGSLLALVIYPWLLEPRLSLRAQSRGWVAGFLLFAAACAVIVWRMAKARHSSGRASIDPAANSQGLEGEPTAAQRALWLFLSACGSVLLCAFTNHLSQNVAAIPLLWIIPLIAYLLSFVWAFNGSRFYPRKFMLGLVALFLGGIAAKLYLADRLTTPIWFTILFYCFCLFLFCLACHAELYRLRPSPRHATAFYLTIAAGGALGSVFVGIFAPLFFSANYELVCGLVLMTLLLIAVTWKSGAFPRIVWSAATMGCVLLAFFQMRQNARGAMDQLRNFYGTLRVTEELESETTAYTRTLYHGTIQHGTQVFSNELRMTPTTYYGHNSGIGLALDYCCGNRPRRVGIIGLGTGTLAAYGRNDDFFRFYDINPLVEKIARNRFTYLRETPAKVDVVLGDARLSLEAEPPQNYDVMVVDAFSGDAIPVHLLTREAIQLYLRHLRPDGILAVHVSNQFLNLPPVVQQEAEFAGLNSVLVASEGDDDIGVYNADWVLVTNNADFLGLQQVSAAGSKIEPLPGLRLWTDDYNSLLPLLKHQKFEWSKDEDGAP